MRRTEVRWHYDRNWSESFNFRWHMTEALQILNQDRSGKLINYLGKVWGRNLKIKKGFECQLNSSETNLNATSYSDVLGNYTLLTSEFGLEFGSFAITCLCQKQDPYRNDLNSIFLINWKQASLIFISNGSSMDKLTNVCAYLYLNTLDYMLYHSRWCQWHPL